MDCAVCHAPIADEYRRVFCLPMYEGHVNWSSNVFFPVCEDCEKKHPQPSGEIECR